MSGERALVDLFHEALDAEDVARPFQRLQFELENPNGTARGRRARRTFMTRNRLVLLAAALVLIIGLTVFVSARVYGTLHVSSVPAGTASTTTVDQLLARPIQFGHVAAGQTCPTAGPNPYAGLQGTGPVYLADGSTPDTNTDWGHYGSSIVLTPPGMVGPVLIRGTDLSSGRPLVQVGPYAAGPVSGADTVNGAAVERHGYIVVLNTGHPPTTTYTFLNKPYLQWPNEYGWAHTTTGFCVGIQIDGPSFTELISDQVNPS